MNINKLVLTKAELARLPKVMSTVPIPKPDAISLATVEKAEPLIRQDVMEYISKNILIGGFFSEPRLDAKKWLKYKAKVEKEG